MPNKDFSAMLKYLRNRSGLTQMEIAKKLGVAKSTISMYENGQREPEFETLEALADYFNVTMDFLLGRDMNNPATAMSDGITNDERAFVERFRRLSSERKTLLLAQLQAWQDI